VLGRRLGSWELLPYVLKAIARNVLNPLGLRGRDGSAQA
jgi:hypothetical protein